MNKYTDSNTKKYIYTYFYKINFSKLIILNIVYLLLLVFVSRGYIDIFSQKEILFVIKFDQSFFSGNDALYGLRFIRLILKSLSFVPIGLFFIVMKNKKYFAFKGSSYVFFIVNLIALVVFQVVLLDIIIINIYNYVLYFLTYVITVIIGSYMVKKN